MSRTSARTDRHWSTDFVEHLRTIHFALLTISLAIGIVALGSKDIQVSKALTQALQIEEFKQNWDSMRRSLYADAASTINVDLSPPIVEVFTDPIVKKFNFHGLLRPDTAQFAAPMKWHFSTEMTTSPRSLADFRTWWDTFHKGVEVHVPVPIPLNAGNADKNCRLFMHQVYSNLVADPIEPGSCMYEADASTLGEDVESASTRWSETRRVSSPSGQKEMVDLILEPASNKPTKRLTVVIPYEVKVVTLTEAALKRTYSDWRQGTYVDAFHELAGISGEFESIPIEGIVGRVRDIQAKGEQVVELFGLKIPSTGVAWWGASLLLSLQLYFALNLYELTTRIQPSDPGFEVAWIGVYGSRPALATTLLSTVAIPLMTTCLIAANIRLQINVWHGVWIAGGSIILTSAAIAGATIAYLVKLHRIRR